MNGKTCWDCYHSVVSPDVYDSVIYCRAIKKVRPVSRKGCPLFVPNPDSVSDILKPSKDNPT